MTWATAIGLEVHVQLGTRSKLFCGCGVAFGAPPNSSTCPVCMGYPGTLPLLSRRAVELAVRAAVALRCSVPAVSRFVRKHYFYPDLPKGYQITQYQEPIGSGGELCPDDGSTVVGIARVHLEEDAARLVHDRVPGATAVDCNRAGVPLLEIVTRPEISSPAEARRFLRALRELLVYLGISECSMERGQLRVDANLSLARPGEGLGVKQEVKNLNSFAGVERSLSQLAAAQRDALEAGGAVSSTTIGAAAGELTAMRSKEEAVDYRYLPEPDLPPLDLARLGIDPEVERESLPELPAARRARFAREHGLAAGVAAELVASPVAADVLDRLVDAGVAPADAARWVRGPLMTLAKSREGLRVTPPQVAALIAMVKGRALSYQAAKRVLGRLEPHDDPSAVAASMGLRQVRDETRLAGWVDEVLRAHPAEAGRVRDGEGRILEYLVGQVMRRSAGAADPVRARSLLAQRLGQEAPGPES